MLYLDVTPYFWRTEDRGGIYHYIERFLAHLPETPEIRLLVRGRRVIDRERVSRWASKRPLLWVRLPGQLHHLVPVLYGRGTYLSLWDEIPALLGLRAFSVLHDPRSFLYEDELLPLERTLPLYPEFSRLREFEKRRAYFRDRRRALRKSFKRASGIITVSLFSAREIRKLGTTNVPIEAVYHGPLPVSEPEPLPGSLGRKPFVLYVGKLDPLKNIEGLLLAFEKVKARKVALELVLAGPLTWYGRFLKERWRKLEGVHFLDFVSPGILESLYRRALFLILPSFYEGFGLPVAEAFSRGLPVAVSNRAALPEIAGDAALYFDPLSPEEIAAAMEKLFFDEKLRRRLAIRGLARAGKFSWKRCVERTLGLIRRWTV